MSLSAILVACVCQLTPVFVTVLHVFAALCTPLLRVGGPLLHACVLPRSPLLHIYIVLRAPLLHVCVPPPCACAVSRTPHRAG